ncbi:MAG TPA: hypothetical protein EYQ50_09260 [Verrucomicrobiales bacterium]|nr:hypothetical protein [Verrucomicrobiales bacterium]HIL70732.1 hypothetical protein [Verrucomicrobiota bacterium]
MLNKRCRQEIRMRAFTLSELIIASTVFLLVLLGLVSSHLFGMRLFQTTQMKLGVQQEARTVLIQLSEEIKSSRRVRIGRGDFFSFLPSLSGEPQIGNAIQIYPSQDTNDFIRYFRDPTDQNLKRLSSSGTGPDIIARAITNEFVFSAEDHLGNILTNNRNNRVVGMELNFYQLQNPTLNLGPGQLFDEYRWTTRITRRILE